MVIWLPFRNKFHTSSTCPPVRATATAGDGDRAGLETSLFDQLLETRQVGSSLRAVEIREVFCCWMGLKGPVEAAIATAQRLEI